MWGWAHVVAELELAEMRRDMLLRHADISAVDLTLDEVPEPFDVRRDLPVDLVLAVALPKHHVREV